VAVVDQIVGLIRGAGKEPVERDSLYHTVRTFEEWVPGSYQPAPRARKARPSHCPQTPGASPGWPQAARVVRGRDGADEAGPHRLHQLLPGVWAIDRDITPLRPSWSPARRRSSTIARGGELDLSWSVRSSTPGTRATTAAPQPRHFCDGPVQSVALQRRPVGQLDDRTVLAHSLLADGGRLLELLCRDVWKVQPHFAQARARHPISTPWRTCRTKAVLVIGDAGAAPGRAARLPAPLRPGRRVEALDRPAVRVRRVGGAPEPPDHTAVRAVHHTLARSGAAIGDWPTWSTRRGGGARHRPSASATAAATSRPRLRADRNAPRRAHRLLPPAGGARWCRRIVQFLQVA